MDVIPAIDIRGGRCVRLWQGDYDRETVFDDDPIAVAVRWASMGATRIHVVDLDGARDGRQTNGKLVRAIVRAADCSVQTGGGIRDLDTLRDALHSGVSRVVLGTAAVKDPSFLREAIAVARDRLIVSVDARDGIVQLEGWTERSDVRAAPFIQQLASEGVERVVFTDIARDGVLEGPNFAVYEELVARTSLPIVAAGGVSSVHDIKRLAECGVEGAIVGRALYTGDLSLSDALAAVA